MLFTLFGAAAGFLTAEVLLEPARRTLSGGFLLRYATPALGFCLGGASTGTMLAVTNLFFADPSTGNSVAALLAVAPFRSVIGGLLGILEGAMPLAAALGLFSARCDGDEPAVRVISSG